MPLLCFFAPGSFFPNLDQAYPQEVEFWKINYVFYLSNLWVMLDEAKGFPLKKGDPFEYSQEYLKLWGLIWAVLEPMLSWFLGEGLASVFWEFKFLDKRFLRFKPLLLTAA